MKATELTQRPEFDLMKQSDIVSFYHMQMPRWLFCDQRYKTLSLEAKVAYTFLLNRFQLSRMNGWINKDGEVFIIFTRESLAQEIGISYRKAIECFKELVACNLIWEKRCGRGDANQIYLARVILSDTDAAHHDAAPFVAPEPNQETRPAETAPLNGEEPVNEATALPEPHLQTCENGISGSADFADQDLPEPHPSYIEVSKTDASQKEFSQSVTDAADLKTLEIILNQCELSVFPESTAKVFRNAIELLYFSDHIKIGGAVLPQATIRSHLWDLDDQILWDAYEKLRNVKDRKVKNSTAYLMSVIYNSICEAESDLMVDPYLNNFDAPQRGGDGNEPNNGTSEIP